MGFQVTKQTNIILYGAGFRCEAIYKYLFANGYKVSLIVDKRPDKVGYQYICPIVTLESAEWRRLENAVVIVCLQNGMLHDEIAKTLYDVGLERILFLPTAKNYYLEHEMRRCYQNLLDENWMEDTRIPTYDEMCVDESTKEIIRDDGKMLTAWICNEFVFSSTPQDYDNQNIYFGSHISCLKPYLDLYKYIKGDGDYPDEYLAISHGGKKDVHANVLKDRAQLYSNYEKRLNKDADYFSSSPANVIWDYEKNRFVVIDGHHRVTYLYSKCWRWLPLRMTIEDYNSYVKYKNSQDWSTLEEDGQRKLLLLAINLLMWSRNNEVFFGRIDEMEENKGFISWWLKLNERSLGENSLYIGMIENLERKYNYFITTNDNASQFQLELMVLEGQNLLL